MQSLKIDLKNVAHQNLKVLTIKLNRRQVIDNNAEKGDIILYGSFKKSFSNADVIRLAQVFHS